MIRVAAALLLLVGCGGELPSAEATPDVVEETPETVTPEVSLPVARSSRRIVIDAGHGGEDLGAVGVSGIQEKDITLAISRSVARQLRERDIEVVETRTADVALRLARRSEIGNASGAGLFVSIHANSAPAERAHGIETYSMDLAADEASMRLAERENREAAVVGRPESDRDLDAILGELRQGVVAERSAELAEAVHSSLVTGLKDFYGGDRIVDRGARTAPFWVLVDSEVPAILVEVGYLTNEAEERRIRTGGYQHRVATALADALAAWVEAEEPGDE